MRQVVLTWLFWYCVIQVFLRRPINWVATRITEWGLPVIEMTDKPSHYVEGSWREGGNDRQ